MHSNALSLKPEIISDKDSNCPELELNQFITKSEVTTVILPGFRQLEETKLFGNYLYKIYSEDISGGDRRNDLFLHIFNWNVQINQGVFLKGLNLEGDYFIEMYRASAKLSIVVTIDRDYQGNEHTKIHVIEI